MRDIDTERDQDIVTSRLLGSGVILEAASALEDIWKRQVGKRGGGGSVSANMMARKGCLNHVSR